MLIYYYSQARPGSLGVLLDLRRGGKEKREREELQAPWQRRLLRELEEAYLWADDTNTILYLVQAKSDSLYPLLLRK